MSVPDQNSEPSYATAKGFCLTASFWMVIATLYGFIGAVEFVAPDLLGNIAWLVFGRIRAVHTNLVIFGFVTPALLSVGHFIVPHLLKTQLFSERLGVLTVIEIRHPGGAERKGVFRLTTTRGDRLFMTLLGSVYIFLAWLGLFGMPLWAPLALAILWGVFCFWKV